jgi:hypothetical protein
MENAHKGRFGSIALSRLIKALRPHAVEGQFFHTAHSLSVLHKSGTLKAAVRPPTSTLIKHGFES